ncbi:MAG: GAF domain-containing protein [Acidobacteria bacterium]|nr:MAG: GAF domain-containing protein [Acidobacteriota bacterium]
MTILEPFENLTKRSCSVNLEQILLQIFPVPADFYSCMANTEKLFEKAQKMLLKQKFDAAFEIFRELLVYEPGNEAVLLNLADLSYRLERKDDYLRFHRLLADLYMEHKVLPKAIATCQKILKTTPQDIPTLARLALLLKQSGKTSEAIDAFRKASVAYRRNQNVAQALECLQHRADLDPDSLDAQTELAEVACETGNPALGASALMRAGKIARKNGMEERWAEMADRAHRLDPSNKAAGIAAAEVCLARGRAREAALLLEPLSLAAPDDLKVLELLCRAYLSSREFGKAEPLCLRLYQTNPETISLAEQLIRGLLSNGEKARAFELLGAIKEQMCLGQGMKNEFLALAEQVYHADENNLEILELLPPLYNEFNRESDLRLALARLFNLYLASERYDKAADTLESILDVDPYGIAHSDRLLNLEGHIDNVWYRNIAARISVPGLGLSSTSGLSQEQNGEPKSGPPAALDDLIVEAEICHRYNLTSKLMDVLQRIDRHYPGAHITHASLSELYEMSGFEPAPFENPAEVGASTSETVPQPAPYEELGKISSIAMLIHRQGTPERVLSTAAEQLGTLVGASRCWISIGRRGSDPITAEYIAAGLTPSDPQAALTVCSLLAELVGIGPEGWTVDRVASVKQLEPISSQLHQLGIFSFVAVPLIDKEQLEGILLLEQCQAPRRWTEGEKVLARSVASQVAIAIHSTRLRRLVRSLAGTDLSTGLLPRSVYLDCLLAEARRAEEQSRPLSVCLMEPSGAARLSRTYGNLEMQSYIRRVGGIVSSRVRQNDIAIRYGSCTFALCLPDTPLADSRPLIENLQSQLCQVKIDSVVSPDFCAVAGELFFGMGFDAVDAVTEVINRLEGSMETMRKQPGGRILLSTFAG